MYYLSYRSINIFICPLYLPAFKFLSIAFVNNEFIHLSHIEHLSIPRHDPKIYRPFLRENFQICIIFWVSHTTLSIMTRRNWKLGESWVSAGEGRQSETNDSLILLYFLWTGIKHEGANSKRDVHYHFFSTCHYKILCICT